MPTTYPDAERRDWVGRTQNEGRVLETDYTLLNFLNSILLDTLVGWEKTESSLASNSLGRELVIGTEASRMGGESRIVVRIVCGESVDSSAGFVEIVAEDHHSKFYFSVVGELLK